MTEYIVVPRPAHIEYVPGNFECRGIPGIAPTNGAADFENEARVFGDQIRKTWGEDASSHNSDKIRLKKTADMAEESYRLEILSGKITLNAASGAGIYRGLQVLRQLFLSEYGEKISIPCGIIDDRPRFPWRGFMLDCSRYFYSIGFIKKLLDALSLQHINIFHWHLTDDQGWRLPVRQYPLLTEIASLRHDRRDENRLIGGFYTEAEIRDIVTFAKERHIEVVPEVDLPGHASAILAAYPEMGCTGGPYQVEDRFGIFDEVLCAGNDALFHLAEAVFDTLTALFPSPYVHIGGDEVRFKRWAECPRCQKRLADLSLHSPGQLQSWISAKLVRMLRERGKTAIGWDEVLENTGKSPLDKDLIVMSWRGQKEGVKAAAGGHRVIMTPEDAGCYLDRKNADEAEEPGRLSISTIEQAYRMDPLAQEMERELKDAALLILGGQGNLWSEVIYAGKIAEYMIFPRICALAETLWTERKSKNFDDFMKRLNVHQCRLDKLGLLQYRAGHFC